MVDMDTAAWAALPVVERLRGRITGPQSCDVRWGITKDLRDAADRIEQLEDILYAWLLKSGGADSEDLFDYDYYKAAYEALGLPERVQELKARFQSTSRSQT